jgi:membrane protein
VATEGTVDDVPSRRTQAPDVAAIVSTLGRLAASTTRVCLRYRVTGLAAEAGFFALLSLPPLVLGLVASAGYVGARIGSDVVSDLRHRVAQLAGTVLTPDAVSSVIMPTFNEVVRGGRPDIVSLGFVLSLWSGSRALNVYVDTVSIMYGLGGRRGIVRTRTLSFSLYVAALMLGVVLIPLMLVGPGLISKTIAAWLGMHSLSWLGVLYWPVVTVFSVAGLTTLYHVATPVRTPWRRDLPGAVLALLIWLLASVVLRLVLAESVGGTSIYGPLSSPIVVLIWLYALALAVLIGAALNAAVDAMYPHPKRVLARGEPLPYPGGSALTPLEMSDETAPDETAPDETAPDETATDAAAPDETAPDETASNEAAPDEAAPDEAAPNETAPQEAALDKGGEDRAGEELPAPPSAAAVATDETDESDAIRQDHVSARRGGDSPRISLEPRDRDSADSSDPATDVGRRGRQVGGAGVVRAGR